MVRASLPGLALLIVFGAVSVSAEEPLELTPFVGYRLGGEVEDLSTGDNFDVDPSASYGLIFDYPLSPETTFQFQWSRQDTEIDTEGSASSSFGIDVDYFHVGATYSPASAKARRGFVVITVGATSFDPDKNGYNSKTSFSVAAGGGVNIKLSDRLGLRFGGKAYLTFVSGSSAAFCSGGGTGASCALAFSGDAFVQVELNAGLIVAF